MNKPVFSRRSVTYCPVPSDELLDDIATYFDVELIEDVTCLPSGEPGVRVTFSHEDECTQFFNAREDYCE